MTPAELSRAVREAFAYAARYLALLTENNPKGTAASLLARPDVEAVLRDALDQGRQAAEDAVRQAWGSAPHTEYLDWLLADVEVAYRSLAMLRADIRDAWASVPQAAFQPGVTPPGTNPSMAAAHRRAEAVSTAVASYGAGIALRNSLSVEVALTASRTAREIAGGEQLERTGQQVWKEWRCSKSPPDERTCHWCRALHGMAIPLSASFPAGTPTDLTGHGRLTRPPRLYHRVLKGPPRHPRCRCRIVVVTHLPRVPSGTSGSQERASEGTGDAAPNMSAPGFLAATDIREMPEDRFQALIHFLEAAVHELGQVVGRLARLFTQAKS